MLVHMLDIAVRLFNIDRCVFDMFVISPFVHAIIYNQELSSRIFVEYH
jgi:hypothetical protein